MRFTALSLALVAVSSVAAMPNHRRSAPVGLELAEVAKFVEGFIYGVVKQESSNLDTCITDVENIAHNVEISVNEFKKENFDGIKAGLLDLGNAVKLIPTAVSQCKAIEQDLSAVAKMAEVFSNPFSLIYHVGKNLVINGIDIFEKIAKALIAYGEADYFSFGTYVGEAMAEVFLKAPTPKKQTDRQAYEFLDGFYSALNANSPLDQQQLYNNIDGLGIMIYGPVQESMQEYTREGNLTQKAWMTLHEISHSLQEGGESLLAKGAITAENLNDLKGFSECLNRNTPEQIDVATEQLFSRSYILYNAGQTSVVGYTYGQIAVQRCGTKSKFLSF
ncbi:UNKNOWN [Stylonychia lemnae]|uniref:Uncharacterized protein n=1 Tax=Stylonychia lemnae TaxID=5949 RepID=A0A078A4A5_STYLE|nr:UNKNOWN [Stylonychia lemnae]|eukprot:CDW75594.1 UNKNOWN [Stylonychia lemnae]